MANYSTLKRIREAKKRIAANIKAANLKPASKPKPKTGKGNEKE